MEEKSGSLGAQEERDLKKFLKFLSQKVRGLHVLFLFFFRFLTLVNLVMVLPVFTFS